MNSVQNITSFLGSNFLLCLKSNKEDHIMMELCSFVSIDIGNAGCKLTEQ